MRKQLEIRPAEGGEDSKLFAIELMQAYQRLAIAKNWKLHGL
jgi:protein subunit release factor A